MSLWKVFFEIFLPLKEALSRQMSALGGGIHGHTKKYDSRLDLRRFINVLFISSKHAIIPR